MRNSADKTRDMARSILPSTSRRSARDNRRISHKRARALNRARLHRASTFGWDTDEAGDPFDDYTTDLGNRSRWFDDTLVGSRQAADKVNPLIRWATVLIDRDPVLRDGGYDERYRYFAGVLGDTLPGRHALSHLEHLFGRRNPHEYGHWAYEQQQARRRAARAAEPSTVELIGRIVAAGHVGALNTAIKRRWPARAWLLCGRCGARVDFTRPAYNTSPHDLAESHEKCECGRRVASPYRNVTLTEIIASVAGAVL